MSSYYERRQILSDALCPYLAGQLQTFGFPELEVGGTLLTSDATPITPKDSLGTMAQVMSARLTRRDGQRRYVAIIFQPLDADSPVVSILTDPKTVRHIVEIRDADLTESITHLKSLIEKTLQDLSGN